MFHNDDEEREHGESELLFYRQLLEEKQEKEEKNENAKINNKENNVENNPIKEELSVIPKPLTVKEVAKIFSEYVAPFCGSRVMFVATNMGIAFVLPVISKEAASAGSLLTSIQFLLTGPSRAGMLATGILCSNEFGKKNYAEIGKISRQSWLLAVVFSVPIISLMSSMENILSLAGIDAEISRQVGKYFSTYRYGVWPTLVLAADQQVAMSTGHPRVPLFAVIGYSATALGLGVPMALGYFGEEVAGIQGLGLGMTFTAWINLVALRLYMFLMKNSQSNEKEYARYQLFELTLKDSWSYLRSLLKTGSKMGTQVLTEWLYTAILTYTLGYINSNNLLIIQPSIQLSTSLAFVSLGFSQGQATLISKKLGESERTLNNKEGSLILEKNKQDISTIGNFGIASAAVFFALICGIFALMTKELVQLFVGDAATTAESDTAKNILLINLLRIWFDTIRNDATGNLTGFKTIFAPTAISFSLMSLVGLSAGGYIVEKDNSLTNFFWLQTVMVFLSALGNILLWSRINNFSAEKQVAVYESKKEKISPKIINDNVINSSVLVEIREESKDVLSAPLLESNNNSYKKSYLLNNSLFSLRKKKVERENTISVSTEEQHRRRCIIL